MLGLRSTRRAAPAARRPFARPSLEAFESRYVPTALLTLGVKYEIGRDISLGGTLTGVANVSNVTVTLSGKVSGTATTDSNGNYDVTLTATGLGTVYASAAGASASEELWDITPIITSFSASEGAGNVWTFSGTVRYRRLFDSLTVNFGGSPVNLQCCSTGTDDEGSFSWAVTLSGTTIDNGAIWAQAVSPWGTASEKAYDYVLQTGT
jgi:hypothetical protein